MMYKQIIFCMETNKHAATDLVYIGETINRFYNVGNNIHLEKEFLNGKGNYNAKNILKSIAKKTKEYEIGDTHVVYCIDVDDFESNPNHIREFEEIQLFCKQKGYQLVWFCHDVEDVYLGRRILKAEKTKAAESFRSKNKIASVNEASLRSKNNHTVHSSNILSVLDSFFLEE